MDLSNPWMLASGLFLGIVGTALLIYGKKQMDFRCLAAGLALCVVPYFISSLLVLWLVSAGVMGSLYAWIKHS